MTCGTDIVAQRDADQRITYSLNGNYTFANLSPRLKVWQASGSVEDAFLTVTTSSTANGSVWTESDGNLILTLDKLDLDALPEGELLYDITLTDLLGFENPFVGGVFSLYDNGAESCGPCTSGASFYVGGQCVSVSIQGGALGVAASVLLADLNTAVAAAEASAEEAADSVASIPGLIAGKLNTDGTNPAAGLLANIGAVASADLADDTGAGLVGVVASGTGAVARTTQAKMRDTVSVFDFIPVAEQAAILDGTSTYNATAAINAAHTAALKVIYPGSSGKARYNATAITIPFGGSVVGDGVEAVRIVQVAATASNFITLATGGTSGDITSGRSLFRGVTIEPANVAFTGIKIGPNVRANMVKFENVVLKSQAVATFGSPPYATTAGSIGIDVSNGTGSAFLGRADGLIVQGFETAVKLGAVVNDWSFDEQCWFIDNKIAFDLTDVSGITFSGDFESGVANARCYILRGSTSHLLDTSRRWELTQSGVFGIEFAGGFTGHNIRVMSPNVQLADGGVVPGNKWTGTPPADFVFHGYYLDGSTLRPFMFSGGLMLMPSTQRIGGSGQGNADVTFGRNASGADSFIQHDGTHFKIRAGNSLRLFGDGAGAAGVGYKVDVTGVGVGFNGLNGVAPPALPAAATDPATTQALVNAIRSALIANGLTT